MKFLYPYFLLWLLPLAAVCFFYWKRRGPSILVPSLHPYRIASGKSDRINWRKSIHFTCFLLSGVLTILALARPRTGIEEITIHSGGIDIILALDVSGSMLAFDVPDAVGSFSVEQEFESGRLKNRLGTAKLEMEKFIQRRKSDRIGLIRFAQGPEFVCPMTLDHADLLDRLKAIETDEDLLGTQTGIAAPLFEALESLKNSKAKNAVIVLFTDGRDNVESHLSPLEVAGLAAKQNVRIYTVGIGSHNTYYPERSFFGKLGFVRIDSDFDEPLLQKIAETTNAAYYRVSDAKGLSAAMKQIDELEKTELSKKVVVHSKEWYPYLAAAAALLILVGTALRFVFLPRLP